MKGFHIDDKSIVFDFYRTIVHEDGVVIDEIITIISNTGDGTKKHDLTLLTHLFSLL